MSFFMDKTENFHTQKTRTDKHSMTYKHNTFNFTLFWPVLLIQEFFLFITNISLRYFIK